MPDPGTLPRLHPFRAAQWTARSAWLDRLWLGLLAILVAYGAAQFQAGRYCAYGGTDFRGYYAAAQIARQRGFAQIYYPPTQQRYQTALPHRCPDGSTAPALIEVAVPYLPVYLLVFVPFTLLDFTAAYYVWVALNLAALLVYLRRFTHALGASPGFVRLLQWALCVPVLANLALGQSNVFLVVCLGEFGLASLHGRRRLGGAWLAGLLVKPHVLILLLPGLALRKNWPSLLGFSGAALAALLASLLLAGWQGVWAAVRLAVSFSGPLIQTGPSMMNFRALALNLTPAVPAWLAWGLAGLFSALAAGLALYLWRRRGPANGPMGSPNGGVEFLILIIATCAATFAITWHAHFYLLMLLLPFLLALDAQGRLSGAWRWAWLAGPPLVYALLFLADPLLARNRFGLAMLAVNLFLLAWSAWRLSFPEAAGSSSCKERQEDLGKKHLTHCQSSERSSLD